MSLDVAVLRDWQGEIDDLRKEPSEVTGLRRPGKEVIPAALSLPPRLQITFIWCYSKTAISAMLLTEAHTNMPICTVLRGPMFCLLDTF